MTLDSGFAGFLGMLRSAGAPGSFDGEPDEMRARMTQAIEGGWDPSTFAPVASEEDVTVGHLSLKVFRPEATGPVPTVLYFHPGGFVTGSAHLMQDVARRLSHELSAVVVSVDYRLAPENPFPAAVEDASAALDWVRANVGRLGADAGRIGLAGESSGGNLAAVTALLAARSGNPVRALLLASPVTDFTASYPSTAENATGYFLETEDLAVIGKLYFRGDHETARDVRVSPALAGDLGGLPPTVVGVAGFDPLRDDGVVFAARLLQAGVPTTLRVYADLIHPFFGMPAVSPGADRAVTELTALFAAELG
ncbi:alpha/beta hydrolase [Streptosporangium sp. NPDC051022]|uniref:alpha/beta hydrolase n=1 Tax=Streptosporangium sp. NPDC051022 TaxID=3155752 RepID=UPI0034462FCF